MTLPDAQHRRAIWLWGSFPRKTQSIGLGADGVAGNAGGGHHHDNSYVALHCGAMKPTRDDRCGRLRLLSGILDLRYSGPVPCNRLRRLHRLFREGFADPRNGTTLRHGAGSGQLASGTGQAKILQIESGIGFG